MKKAYQIILVVLACSCAQHLNSSPFSQEEAVANVMVNYVKRVNGLSINWAKSISDTARIARSYDKKTRVVLAFFIEGDESAISPPADLLNPNHSLTHHEAINSTLEDSDYEFIWPAAAIDPERKWNVTVLVRLRDPNP